MAYLDWICLHRANGASRFGDLLCTHLRFLARSRFFPLFNGSQPAGYGLWWAGTVNTSSRLSVSLSLRQFAGSFISEHHLFRKTAQTRRHLGRDYWLPVRYLALFTVLWNPRYPIRVCAQYCRFVCLRVLRQEVFGHQWFFCAQNGVPFIYSLFINQTTLNT